MGSPEDQTSKPARKIDTWAEFAIKEADFIRNNAALVNLDASRLVRGFTLLMIVDDDRNIFAWIDQLPFKAALGRQSAKQLNIRVNWEIATPELPENIRERLLQVRDGIQTLDLGKSFGFISAYHLWNNAREFVRKEIHTLPVLQEDINYYIASKNILADLPRKNPLPK